MAYTVYNATINGETVPSIELTSGEGGSTVILEESLSAYDKSIMNAIADVAGEETFLEKMTAFTLPNGKNALDLYSKLIVNVVELDALKTKATANISSLVAGQVDLKAKADDFEFRIDALENA